MFWQPPVSTCDASRTFNSAAALTVVVELSVLLPGVGSLSLLAAEAELVTVPADVDLAVIVTVAVAPGAIVPRFAVTVPVEPTGGVTSEPCDVVAETKVIEAGSMSVNTAPVAEFEALRFFTTTLYVSFSPAKIGLADCVMVVSKSTDFNAGMPFAEALLFPGLESEASSLPLSLIGEPSVAASSRRADQEDLVISPVRDRGASDCERTLLHGDPASQRRRNKAATDRGIQG